MADYPIFSRQHLIDAKHKTNLKDRDFVDDEPFPNPSKEEIERINKQHKEEQIKQRGVPIEEILAETTTKLELVDALHRLMDKTAYIGNHNYPDAERYLGITDGMHAIFEVIFDKDPKYLQVLREEIPSNKVKS